MAAPWRILGIVTLTGVGAPALPQPTSAPKQLDPNELVCERVKLPGSRVEARKLCGTRAQWAELRKRERDMAKQAERPANDRCQAVAMYPMAPGC